MHAAAVQAPQQPIAIRRDSDGIERVPAEKKALDPHTSPTTADSRMGKPTVGSSTTDTIPVDIEMEGPPCPPQPF